MFTIFYVFAGVAIALYGLSIIAAHFVEVREEFWLERLSKIKVYHPKNLFEKIIDFFSYKSEKLVNEYQKSAERKK